LHLSHCCHPYYLYRIVFAKFFTNRCNINAIFWLAGSIVPEHGSNDKKVSDNELQPKHRTNQRCGGGHRRKLAGYYYKNNESTKSILNQASSTLLETSRSHVSCDAGQKAPTKTLGEEWSCRPGQPPSHITPT
jgi:hypothetical protein